MRRVLLLGELGERYGREWSLDVATPAEALRAIDVNRPGFFQHLVQSAEEGVAYGVLLDSRALEPEELGFPFGQETFTVAPAIGGAGVNWGGVGKTIAGAVLVGAALYFSGGTLSAASPLLGISYGSIAMFGVALMAGGISQLTAGTPHGLQDGNPADKKASYYFNGPVNTIAQGGPVPIGIGRMIVGSTTIDAGIQVDEIPI